MAVGSNESAGTQGVCCCLSASDKFSSTSSLSGLSSIDEKLAVSVPAKIVNAMNTSVVGIVVTGQFRKLGSQTRRACLNTMS